MSGQCTSFSRPEQIMGSIVKVCKHDQSQRVISGSQDSARDTHMPDSHDAWRLVAGVVLYGKRDVSGRLPTNLKSPDARERSGRAGGKA